MLGNLIRRLKAFPCVNYNSDTARFVAHSRVRLSLAKDSRIEINAGTCILGFPMFTMGKCAGHGHSHLVLSSGSRLIINGDVFIAPGFTIRIKSGATLVFGGFNHIAQNFFLLCSHRCEIGRDTVISWNVTMIDDDGHAFQSIRKGKEVTLPKRPLILQKNIGVQMHVTIPRGVTVGDNAVISASTVVRQDVPANSVAYTKQEMKINTAFCKPT